MILACWGAAHGWIVIIGDSHIGSLTPWEKQSSIAGTCFGGSCCLVAERPLLGGLHAQTRNLEAFVALLRKSLTGGLHAWAWVLLAVSLSGTFQSLAGGNGAILLDGFCLNNSANALGLGRVSAHMGLFLSGGLRRCWAGDANAKVLQVLSGGLQIGWG